MHSFLCVSAKFQLILASFTPVRRGLPSLRNSPKSAEISQRHNRTSGQFISRNSPEIRVLIFPHKPLYGTPLLGLLWLNTDHQSRFRPIFASVITPREKTEHETFLYVAAPTVYVQAGSEKSSSYAKALYSVLDLLSS